MPSTKHVSNDKDLKKIETRRKHILNIWKRQLEFLGYVMWNGGLESLMLTRQIDGKRERGKHHVTYLINNT